MPSGDQKTTTATTPWSGLIPYLQGAAANPKKGTPAVKGVLPEAGNLYSSGGFATHPYPGSTVAPMDPATAAGLQAQQQRAQMGSPLNAAAGAETLKTLGGDYLGQSNPYLDAIRSNGRREASRIAGQFGAGGRTGSGAMQDSIAAGYGSAVAPYEYGAYENERGRMQNAAQFAPTLAQQDYVDAGALRDVGQARQQQSQAELTDQVQRWLQEQGVDAQALERYANLVTGVGSQYSTTTTTQPGTDPLQAIIGGMLGLGSSFAGPSAPWFLL